MFRKPNRCPVTMVTIEEEGAVVDITSGAHEDHCSPCAPNEIKYLQRAALNDLKLSAEFWTRPIDELTFLVKEFCEFPSIFIDFVLILYY